MADKTATIMDEHGRVEVHLHSEQGSEKFKTLNLPSEFATRFIVFDEQKYEQYAPNDWALVSE